MRPSLIEVEVECRGRAGIKVRNYIEDYELVTVATTVTQAFVIFTGRR